MTIRQKLKPDLKNNRLQTSGGGSDIKFLFPARVYTIIIPIVITQFKFKLSCPFIELGVLNMIYTLNLNSSIGPDGIHIIFLYACRYLQYFS